MAAAVSLRPARDDDRDAVAILWRASAGLPGVATAQLPPPAAIRARVDRDLAAGWVLSVAQSGEDLVGMLALRPDLAVLDQIFVAPGWLGRGVGRLLMDAAKIAMPAGFTLHTGLDNHRAQRFYAASGLALLGDRPDPRTGATVRFYQWRRA
ncbi:hypothetical protein IP88_06880 [alpha proteobacterium AAP81b]|nr:hypothetical protein IP88_06880 [alpha proteobacterium AAP81b]